MAEGLFKTLGPPAAWFVADPTLPDETHRDNMRRYEWFILHQQRPTQRKAFADERHARIYKASQDMLAQMDKAEAAEATPTPQKRRGPPAAPTQATPRLVRPKLEDALEDIEQMFHARKLTRLQSRRVARMYLEKHK